MQVVRLVALTGRGGWRRAPVNGTQPTAARLLKVSVRTVAGWEASGARLLYAYAYVGLAYRLGGESRAREVLELLSSVAELEGAAVAARRSK